MYRFIAVWMFIAAVLCSVHARAQTAPPQPDEPPAYEAPLTNDEIVKLTKAGLGTGAIVAKIKQAASETLDVSTDALIDLRQKKVSSAVIEAMVERVTKDNTRAETQAAERQKTEKEAEAAKAEASETSEAGRPIDAKEGATEPALKGSPVVPERSRATLSVFPKEPFGPLALLAVAYRDGATRLMVQIYAPASAVGTGEGVNLLVLARDKDGKEAVYLEEAAGLRKTRADFFTDRTFRVVPGDYDVAAALVDLSGKVLVSARRPVFVPALPRVFAASLLLIAVSDSPANAPRPEDPFTFSARHFVVKGDGRLDAADGLYYAVRIYNPPVDPVSRTITLKRTIRIRPKGQPSIDVPTPPEEPQKVSGQEEGGALVVDLAGGVIESNLGQYLKPNDYELWVTILDPGTQKKLDLVTPFTVVSPAAPAAKRKG